MTRRARIEIAPAHFPDDPCNAGCPHFLRLRASNGRILAHSETYANKRSAQRAVEAWMTAFDDVAKASEGPWEVDQ